VQYYIDIAQYYQLLHPPAQFGGIFEVFRANLEVFFLKLLNTHTPRKFFLAVGFWTGRGVWKQIRSRAQDPERESGELLHIIVIAIAQCPPRSPLDFAYNIAQLYIFLAATPFIEFIAYCSLNYCN